MSKLEPETISPKDLTADDWAEMEKLKQVWEAGGLEALSEAQAQLRRTDPIRWYRIVRAFFPDLANDIWLRFD
jgi:hypothetical protein